MEDNTDKSAKKKSSKNKGFLAIIIIFLAFTIFVFLTQQGADINWVKDYERGIKMSEEQNKPAMLCFYKLFTQYTTPTLEQTFKSDKLKEYLEANYIPILIDVTKHPKVAEEYEVNYYPTYIIRLPDSEKLLGPLQGHFTAGSLIRELKDLMEKAEKQEK